MYAIINNIPYAGVVESADTRDLKSLGSNTVPVQVRSPAPNNAILNSLYFFQKVIAVVTKIAKTK